ncbi:MAG TPA: maleylpyruvate isomerase N-terminal domain-containing protein [Acidimicrobiia bacterium]|nr:maleylpyruvate isomerase N-terminal domain-containing protein [Acidimicrobiia bacterium]
MGEREQVMAALRGASRRFCDLVESLDPADAARPVEGLDWNVGDTVAHVLTVVRRGFADLRRSDRAEATAALNALCLEETPERDPQVLGELLRRDLHTALDVVFPAIPDDRVFPFHGGVSTTMTPALRVVLGEFVVHGFDVARAVDRPWPVAGDEARLLVPGELLGAWLRPEAADGAFEIRIAGAAPLLLTIRARRLSTGCVPPAGSAGAADVAVIALDPAEFVLGFYGRVPVADPGLLALRSRFLPA